MVQSYPLLNVKMKVWRRGGQEEMELQHHVKYKYNPSPSRVGLVFAG